MHKSHLLHSAVAAVALFGAASVSLADLTGFSSFDPINVTAAPTGTATQTLGVNGNSLVITDGRGNLGTSIFSNQVQNVANGFLAEFDYVVPGDGGQFNRADGFSFTLQNSLDQDFNQRGTTALGSGGGDLGYSGTGSITNSVSLQTNLYSAKELRLRQGGAATNYSSVGLSNTGAGDGVIPNNGVLKHYKITYNPAGNVFTQTVTEPSTGRVTQATFGGKTNNLSLVGQLGASTAFVGFTGGSGGVTAEQTISNFKLTTNTAASVYTPINVTGFNRDAVVDASLSNDPAVNVNGLSTINATLDHGSNRNTAGNLYGATFYERGFKGTTGTTRGLPMGQTFNADSIGTGGAQGGNTSHSFKLGAANVNNGLLLEPAYTPTAVPANVNAGNTTGRLTFADGAQPFKSLSVLSAAGNAGAGLGYAMVIHFIDGTTETQYSGIVDWYGKGQIALSQVGRVGDPSSITGLDGGAAGSATDTGGPNLYYEDFLLAKQNVPIDYIDFNMLFSKPINAASIGQDGAHGFIFGLSGVANGPAVPEPTSLGLLGLGGLALLRRRR